MAYQNPPGVNDLLPATAFGIQHIIRAASDLFGRYGYRYVETPLFEKTEVFTRGIGEATDIVGKEMYYVFPMSSIEKAVAEATGAAFVGTTAPGRPQPIAEATGAAFVGTTAPGRPQSIAEATGAAAITSLSGLALRPEGTAGTARAVVQHNLFSPGAPTTKLWYAGSMFRHERQQKGRYREFRQIGAECFGATEPSADAEVIIMLMGFFEALGIPRSKMVLKVNSMGDDTCRPLFQTAVKDFILARKDEFCPECLRRASTNPLRAFDCKSPSCQTALESSPRITDFLCEECSSQYAVVRDLLAASGLTFEEDHRLVRGFDYYTRTVFEVQVDSGLGSQNAIGGGGRYDGLLEQYGAKHTPSLGFAVGLERILMVLEAEGVAPALPAVARVFVAAACEEARLAAFALASELREAGVSIELDHQGRSLKSQFKAADKLEVDYTVVIGPDEIAQGCFTLRTMSDGTQQSLTREELFEYLRLN